MPVPLQNIAIAHLGTGGVKTFTFNWAYQLDADIAVSVDGKEVSVGYAVMRSGTTGGSVNFTDAPAAGAKIIIWLKVALRRETDYQENGDLFAEVLDRDFDRLWYALQGVGFAAYNALRINPGEDFYDAKGHVITGFAEGRSPGDAVTKGYIDGQITIQRELAAQTKLNADNAAASERSASASSASATQSAQVSQASAAASSTSEAKAKASETSAQQSRNEAVAAAGTASRDAEAARLSHESIRALEASTRANMGHARDSATAAAASERSASASSASAHTDAELAKKWAANPRGAVVADNLFSSRHYAEEASSAASTASEIKRDVAAAAAAAGVTSGPVIASLLMLRWGAARRIGKALLPGILSPVGGATALQPIPGKNDTWYYDGHVGPATPPTMRGFGPIGTFMQHGTGEYSDKSRSYMIDQVFAVPLQMSTDGGITWAEVLSV